jgi:hypothetical protein
VKSKGTLIIVGCKFSHPAKHSNGGVGVGGGMSKSKKFGDKPLDPKAGAFVPKVEAEKELQVSH